MYIRYTKEQLNKIPRMTPKEIKELEGWDDPYDPECPPMTDEQLAQFHRVNKKTA